jgi:hypothetical protein
MSDRLSAALLCLALGGPLLAADPIPLAAGALADGRTLAAHWQSSPFGRAWSDPALAPFRTRLLQECAPLTQALGLELADLLTGFDRLHLRIAAGHDGWPLVHLQADAGPRAVSLFKVLRTRYPDQAAVPGADEAVALPAGFRCARFGTRLVLGNGATVIADGAAEASAQDLTLRCDPGALATLIRATGGGDAAYTRRLLDVLQSFLVPLDGRLDLVADGIAARVHSTAVVPGLAPVDATLADRFPADATSITAFGLDGASLWRAVGPSLVALLTAQDDATQARPRADAWLRTIGITVGIEALVSGIAGTCVVINTPGTADVPGLALALPRSPAVDQAVIDLVRHGNWSVPPDGEIRTITPDMLAAPLHLARTTGHWLLATDTGIARSWLQPGTGAAATALVRTFGAQARPGSCLLAVHDPVAAMADTANTLAESLERSPLTPPERQALVTACGLLAQGATTAWERLRLDDGLTWEGRGLVFNGLGGSLLGLLSSLAAPALDQARIAASERAAASTLRLTIWPAQFQFQQAALCDRDHNQVGDYGFFPELCAGRADDPLGGFLPAKWNAATPLVDGYRFALFIPDGHGNALARPPQGAFAVEAGKPGPDADFVVYAWPQHAGLGRRCFAITSRHTVYASPPGTPLEAPAWNALWQGGTWTDAPRWPAYDLKH